jgi:hypothetical protein
MTETRFSGGPGMPNHIIVIDETPGPDGFGVVCTPHGPIGRACDTRLAAFLRALQHDNRYGTEWL